MSTPVPAPAPHRPGFDLSNWLPARRSLLWVLLAFVIGLVLFALVLSGGRDDDAFFRADQAPPTAASPHYAPLPAPLPAQGDDNASGLGKTPPAERMESGDGRPRLVETAPPAPPPTAPRPATPAATATTRPEPISTPSPRYPTQALRRGESGTVMVKAQIGPDGVPTTVEVAKGSGSRYLDRAATDAVRRWRFRPAMNGEQPVAGTVMVPISFEPQR